MGDEAKARAWEWAAYVVRREAKICLMGMVDVHEANRALDVVAPYLQRMATRIRERKTVAIPRLDE